MGIVIKGDSLYSTLNRIDRMTRAVNDATLDALADVGEYITEEVRNGNMSEWIIDTGNLTSSVGYAVGNKGNIVRISDFDTILQGLEGSKKGRELAHRLIAEYSTYDYVLVLVAGEEYAVYVEAVENKIVLSSGLLYIKKNLVSVLRRKVSEALQRMQK